MICVLYQAKNYTPDQVLKRYVRVDPSGGIHWCEVGKDRRYDVRQGSAGIEDVPEGIFAAAKAKCGSWPSYVEWPI